VFDLSLAPNTAVLSPGFGQGQFVAELDNDRFPVRQKASRELEKMGAITEPALRQALAEKPSLETSKRVARLLETIEKEKRVPSREKVSAYRCLEVLERMGTPEARRVLAAAAGRLRVDWPPPTVNRRTESMPALHLVARVGERLADRRITEAAEGWTADRLGAIERNGFEVLGGPPKATRAFRAAAYGRELGGSL